MSRAGQSILDNCGSRAISEQREGPTTTFGYGLTRFAVYVSLRWEDKTKAILLPHHKALYVTACSICRDGDQRRLSVCP